MFANYDPTSAPTPTSNKKEDIILVINSWERSNLPDSLIQLAEKNKTEHSSIPTNHYLDTCSFSLSYAEFGKMVKETPGNFASRDFTNPDNPEIKYWWYTPYSKFTQS